MPFIFLGRQNSFFRLERARHTSADRLERRLVERRDETLEILASQRQNLRAYYAHGMR